MKHITTVTPVDESLIDADTKRAIAALVHDALHLRTREAYVSGMDMAKPGSERTVVFTYQRGYASDDVNAAPGPWVDVVDSTAKVIE